MARFDQHFITYCLCNSNGVSGELGRKPISTSRGCDEIDYPRAEPKKMENNRAASDLCICPIPITVYLYWLLTAFLYPTKEVGFFFFFFKLSLKSRHRMPPFLRKPELAEAGGFASQNASPHTVARCMVTSLLLLYLIPFNKLMQQCEMIVDARY